MSERLEWTRWPTGQYAMLPPDFQGRCASYAVKPARRGYHLWWFPLDAPPQNLGWFKGQSDAKAHAQRQRIAAVT